MAKAKEAGIQPIMQWNKGTAGLAFPLQNLMGAYGAPEPINDWIFQKDGASINTPDNLEAANHLEGWVKAGYFPADANAIEYFQMMSRFIGGEGLFMFNGDWESGNLDKQARRQVRLLPDAPGRSRRAARHHVGAADLRHRRQGRSTPIAPPSSSTGSRPTPTPARSTSKSAGPTPAVRSDLPIPAVAPGSVTDADAGRRQRGRRARTARWTSSPTPRAPSSRPAGRRSCRSWSAAVQTGQGMLEAVQAEYEKQLSR